MTMARFAIARICRKLQPAIAAGLLVVLATSSLASSSRAQDGEASMAATGGGSETPETGTFERENILKAAFVVNFARYTTWPPTAADSVYRACIVGRSAVGDALRLLEGQTIRGKTIAVSSAEDRTAYASCQMLFISGSEVESIKSILAAIDGKPILTVSDLPEFVHAGGMIGLKVVENRVRFDINALTAKVGGLQLSAQLLRLADLIIDSPGGGN
jgi:hypothetical protein